MQHHAGGVDHGTQREAARPAHALDDARGEGVGVGRRRALLAHAAALGVQRLAHGRRQPRARQPGKRGVGGDAPHELIDRRQAAERGRAVSAH